MNALSTPLVPPEDIPGVMPAGRFRRAQQAHALALVLLPLIGAALAVWQVSGRGIFLWQIVLCAFFYSVTMLSVTVGFHRLLAHKAFTAGPIVRSALIVGACMAAQGPPVYWVTNHRRHHRFSDRPGDPHSPNLHARSRFREIAGLWHAHVAWMFTHDLSNPLVYAKDLVRDPLVARLNALYPVWVLAGFVVPAAIGYAITATPRGAAEGLLWGGLVRLFLSFQFTSCINSVTHALGTHPYTTGDHSGNVSWLALPTMGESWHNNHHAYPSSAALGLRWWQLDPGAWLIGLLRWCGLISQVRTPQASRTAVES